MQSPETNLEAVVCATLLDRPSLIDDISLSYTDFFDEQYSLVYRTIEWLVQNGKQVTNITLIDKLKNRVDEEHLFNVVNTLYSQPWALEQHIQIIRNKSTKKRMSRLAQRLIELSQSDKPTEEILADVEQSLDEIRDTADDSEQELKPLNEIVPKYEQLVEERVNSFRHGKRVGIHTGFEGIDVFTHGFQPHQLYIIGARPSMGKTAITLQSAAGVAKEDVAAVFSIEMDDITLLDRLTAAEARINMSELMTGGLSNQQISLLSQAYETLRKSNVYVDDNSNVSVSYIRSRVRRLKRKIPASKRLVVYVDYLQIMQATRGRSRTEEVGNLSRELKQLAKECDCAVVALAQLSRSVEQRADKRPVLADIRESGQIEQDADCIMFLYRDDYYNKDSNEKGILEVIFAKQRNGKTGTAKLAFQKEYQKFFDTVNLNKEAR